MNDVVAIGIAVDLLVLGEDKVLWEFLKSHRDDLDFNNVEHLMNLRVLGAVRYTEWLIWLIHKACQQRGNTSHGSVIKLVRKCFESFERFAHHEDIWLELGWLEANQREDLRCTLNLVQIGLWDKYLKYWSDRRAEQKANEREFYTKYIAELDSDDVEVAGKAAEGLARLEMDCPNKYQFNYMKVDDLLRRTGRYELSDKLGVSVHLNK